VFTANTQRNLQLENEQRHNDGEHAVAERLDAPEAQFSGLEPIEQTHVTFRIAAKRMVSLRRGIRR